MDRNGISRTAIALAAMALFGCATAPQSPPPAAPSAEPSPAAAEAAPVPEAVPAAPVPAVTAAPPAKAEVAPAPVEKAAPVPVTAPSPVAKPAAPTAPVTPAAPPAKVAVPKDPNTFLITAGPKDKSHPFFGTGHNLGFSVNGVPGKDIVVERGQTYTFDVDTGVQHDFYLTTSPVGWGAGTVSDGVTGQFTYKGQVSFSPTATTPSVLYYQCRNHKSMGGKIYVVNKGEKPKIEATPGAVSEAPAKTFTLTEAQVKQKLAYAELLVVSSEAAKRVSASSNEEAKGLQAQAHDQLAKAKVALAQKDTAQAMAGVDEALRLMNAASRLVPAEAAVDYKARYEEQHKEIKGYVTSYEKNVKAGQGKEASATFDKAKFDALVKDAEGLAAKGDYEAANKNLTQASTMITAVLSLMLDSATVVYEKDFASPKEQYEYELARYQSYHELIPIAIEQKQPNPSQAQMVDELVKKAERIVSEGKGFADRGDYTTAIQALEAATENLQRGLMMMGVR